MNQYLAPLEMKKQYSQSSLPLLKHFQRRDKNYSYDTAESEASINLKLKKRCVGFQKVRGLIFMLLCVICIDFARFLVKYAYQSNENLTPMQQAFGKFAGMNIFVVLIAITACKLRQTLSSIPRYLLCRFITRCFVFTAVSVFQAFGIKMLTYSTSVILSFSAPLLTPFTALIILGERITLCNVISLLICFGGVIIFTNPSLFGQDTTTKAVGQSNSLIGILLMLGSAVARSVDITLMKMLNNAHAQQNKEEQSENQYIIRIIDTHRHKNAELVYDVDSTSLNQLSVLYYLSLVGSFVGALCFGVEEAVATSHEGVGLFQGETVLLILGASVFLLLSQLMYSLATKYEDVGKLASVFYFQIVLAFMWEAFVFKGTIGIAEILGTVIILVTSLTVAIQKLLK